MATNPLPPSPLPAPPPNLPSAAELVWRLAQRGIRFEIRNPHTDGSGGRLWLRPGTAYKELTDEERAVIRHRREELKQLVRDGVPVTAPTKPEGASSSTAPTHRPRASPTKPTPSPVPDHIRRIVDWNKPEERRRREEEATALMLRGISR